jgi:hypothetical protein
LPQRAVEALRIHRKRQLEEPHSWRKLARLGTGIRILKGHPLDAQNHGHNWNV